MASPHNTYFPAIDLGREEILQHAEVQRFTEVQRAGDQRGLRTLIELLFD
jgi:hypothetical protein